MVRGNIGFDEAYLREIASTSTPLLRVYSRYFIAQVNLTDSLSAYYAFRKSTGALLAFALFNETANTLTLGSGATRLTILSSEPLTLNSFNVKLSLSLQLGKYASELDLPEANATNLGRMCFVDEGQGSGTASKLFLCMRSVADAYSWVQVASG